MVLLRVRRTRPSRGGAGQASGEGPAAALRSVLRRPEGAHLQALRRAPSGPHAAREVGGEHGAARRPPCSGLTIALSRNAKARSRKLLGNPHHLFGDAMAELDGPRLEPRTGAARQLVVFLHGYGADGNDLIDIGRAW